MFSAPVRREGGGSLAMCASQWALAANAALAAAVQPMERAQACERLGTLLM
jgi:hypothetical protein